MSDKLTLNNKSPAEKLYFAPEQALAYATVFPDINNVPLGEPNDAAAALKFALTDIRLQLDLHPCNWVLHAHYRKLAREAGYPLIMAQEDNVCPLRWAWIDEPWPWEGEKMHVEL